MDLRALTTISALLLACNPLGPGTTTDGSTSETTSTTAATTGGGTTDEPTGATGATTEETGDTGATGTTEDPGYVRDCEEGDFTCTDWGCEEHGVVEYGQCHKRCAPASPDVVGEPDPACDEPERPFCSQVGLALDGDYVCNGCAFICTSAPIFRCDPDFASCQG